MCMQAFGNGVQAFAEHLLDPDFLHAVKLTLMLAAVAVRVRLCICDWEKSVRLRHFFFTDCDYAPLSCLGPASALTWLCDARHADTSPKPLPKSRRSAAADDEWQLGRLPHT